MSLSNDLQEMLAAGFNVGFAVNHEYEAGNIVFIITPAQSQEDLFTIKATIKNNTRLVLLMEPENYAAEFVRSLGKTSNEQKNKLSSIGQHLISEGARLTMTINGNDVDIADISSWPEKWEKILLKMVVVPDSIIGSAPEEIMPVIRRWLLPFTGLIFSLLQVSEDESSDTMLFHEEGAKYDIETSRYERDPVNREICLQKYGYTCRICGINFEDKYGPIGKDFIHVHHKKPVSAMGGSAIVNPITDLIPVCPNCHAMLHKENPPILPEELKKMIEHNQK